MKRSGLLLDIGVGQQVLVGEAEITLVAKRGRKARLRINAKPEIKIITPKKLTEDNSEKSNG